MNGGPRRPWSNKTDADVHFQSALLAPARAGDAKRVQAPPAPSRNILDKPARPLGRLWSETEPGKTPKNPHGRVALTEPAGHNRPASMSTYECQSCGRSFAVPQKTLDKYPSWQPKNCLRCHSAIKPAASRPANRSRSPRQGMAAAPAFASRSSAAPERPLTLSEVLQTYSDGPATGIFTDGAAHPNPGPGGWG